MGIRKSTGSPSRLGLECSRQVPDLGHGRQKQVRWRLPPKSWRAGRNAVALFDTDLTFGWEELRDDVIGVKYAHVADYFQDNPKARQAFIYRMLTLIDEREDRINHARWVYLLTRMRDLTDDSARFRGFANQLHQWFPEHERRQTLRLALYLYVYATREKENG